MGQKERKTISRLGSNRLSALSRRQASGFTLIEILAVLVFVAVIGGLAVGGLSLPSRSIRSTAQQLHKDIQGAHQHAIRYGKFLRIHFKVIRGEDSEEDDVERGEEVWSYSVEEFEFPKPKPKENPETDEEKKALQEWEEEQRRIENLSLEERLNRTRLNRGRFKEVKKFEIPDSVRVKHLLSARQLDRTEEERDRDLYFYPSGEADDALIVFADTGGRVMSILIDPLSGRTKVEKGEVSMEEWKKERAPE